MTGACTVTPAFWQGRRVLVTGHTGFKGGWLTLWLQSLGAVIRGVSLAPSTQPNLFELAQVDQGIDHHIVDIRDYAQLLGVMAEFKPDVVFHLAAQPLVRLSYQQPVDTYATNVMGTLHVLEATRQAGSVRVIVNVTTDKCYENREWLWGYRENEPMGGSDPYSSSKGCVELLSAAYRKSFLSHEGIAMATGRAGNVIGGGDWAADRLLPDILVALQNQEEILIRNPRAIRPWQHVLEPIAGYMLLAQRLWSDGDGVAEGWNFGPRDEDAQPVSWIVDRMCSLWGGEAKWGAQLGEHPHEANFLKLDTSKARTLLGWRPCLTLDDALQWIVRWHRAWLNGESMREVTISQITQYQSLMQANAGNRHDS